jgi:hypothetical protein
MDNGSSRFAQFLKHNLAEFLKQATPSSDLREYCRKHNIRRINIRSLSELLTVNTTMRCSSDEVHRYSWAKYFNPDCTFSAIKFQQDGHCNTEERFLKKQLLDRMKTLHMSLFENSPQYRGHGGYYILTYIYTCLFSIVTS